MNSCDDYRVKAAELSARAACENNPLIQAELESLARSSRLDLTYETPLLKDDDPAAKR